MPLQAWKAAMTESGAWLESLSADSFTLLPARRGKWGEGMGGWAQIHMFDMIFVWDYLLWVEGGMRSERGRGGSREESAVCSSQNNQ